MSPAHPDDGARRERDAPPSRREPGPGGAAPLPGGGAVGLDAGERYLWDPSAPPDAEVAALEHALAPRRWSGTAPSGAALPARTAAAATSRRQARRARTSRWLRPALFGGALAASLLVALALRWELSRRGDPRYRLEVIEGAPVVVRHGAERAVGPGASGGAVTELRPGERLRCDGSTRARLAVGSIGSVVLLPGSELRVDDPDAVADAEHLLYLARGTLEASIFAAPRLFQVGTPSGIAVDLGCVYTATVADDGTTRLSVTVGQVAFEAAARSVVVPRGASTRATPGHGPGTPTWDDAPERYRDLVGKLDALLDAGARVPAELLVRVLADSRPADTLTLWHLLARVEPALRGPVHDRLAELSPPPPDVRRADCLAGDSAALERWRRSLDWSW